MISRCLDSGLTGTFFGMVSVRTPFSYDAVMPSTLISETLKLRV